MSIENPKFPFPPIPLGQVVPEPEGGSMRSRVERDVNVVRWLVEEECRASMPAGAPLTRTMALSMAADWETEGPNIDQLNPADAHHGVHLTFQLQLLAWSIRALYGRPRRVLRIDKSFVADELLGSDTKERDAERTLAGGVGTMAFAARLVQAAGGRICSINGKQGVGHDLRWETEAGDVVLIERKDRAYEPGLGDQQQWREARVVRLARASKFPDVKGAALVLVVGFAHHVRAEQFETVDKGYQAALRSEFGDGRSPENRPHFVVAEHLGLEATRGGAKAYFWVPALLKPDDRILQTVGPLLVSALGLRRS
jgi:hypothetical protein